MLFIITDLMLKDNSKNRHKIDLSCGGFRILAAFNEYINIKEVRMLARLTDLMDKDVICLDDGQSLGRICDAEIDICEQNVCALVIFGRLKFFGLFGREEDLIIKWDDIELIGEDTILVKKFCCNSNKTKRKKKFF